MDLFDNLVRLALCTLVVFTLAFVIGAFFGDMGMLFGAAGTVCVALVYAGIMAIGTERRLREREEELEGRNHANDETDDTDATLALAYSFVIWAKELAKQYPIIGGLVLGTTVIALALAMGWIVGVT